MRKDKLENIHELACMFALRSEGRVQRDLTVAAINAFACIDARPPNSLVVLDALSASGLRALRVALEVPSVRLVIANDKSSLAFGCLEQNVENHRCALECAKVDIECSCCDASEALSTLSAAHRRIDVIDIDPFGSPMHAVPAALACIHSGGILSIAFFDLNVLCGSMRSSDSAAVCFATYAATPLNMRPAHEVAVRMALGTCCRIAASLGRSIHPLLCANMQSCIRLILRVTNIDAPLTLSLPSPQSSSGGLPPSSASFQDHNSSPARDCKLSGAPPPSFASIGDAAWLHNSVTNSTPLHSGISNLALSYIFKCAVCCGWALQKVGCATASARTSACEVCGGVGKALLGGPIYDAALADSGFLQECARQVA